MNHQITETQANEAFFSSWAAIGEYAQKNGLCHGCLSYYVMERLINYVISTQVADDVIGDFKKSMNKAMNNGIEQKIKIINNALK